MNDDAVSVVSSSPRKMIMLEFVKNQFNELDGPAGTTKAYSLNA